MYTLAFSTAYANQSPDNKSPKLLHLIFYLIYYPITSRTATSMGEHGIQSSSNSGTGNGLQNLKRLDHFVSHLLHSTFRLLNRQPHSIKSRWTREIAHQNEHCYALRIASLSSQRRKQPFAPPLLSPKTPWTSQGQVVDKFPRI